MTSRDPLTLPRYSARPFPPYSYVPGVNPHPVSDPCGHMHGHQPQAVEPLDPADWSASEAYRYAIDLFNRGYYWESHETWESLWHAAGRRGPVAIWLKALIKLAAAAVKLREGNAHGATRHAARALDLLHELAELGLNSESGHSSSDLARSGLAPGGNAAQIYCGLNTQGVQSIAAEIAGAAGTALQPDPTRTLTQKLELPST